jgi:hypothetical protein
MTDDSVGKQLGGGRGPASGGEAVAAGEWERWLVEWSKKERGIDLIDSGGR